MGIRNKVTNLFLDLWYHRKILEDIIPRDHIKLRDQILHPPHSTSYFALNKITSGNIYKEINFRSYNNFYDIGCGYGRVLLYFDRFFEKLKLRYSIYGLELNEEIFLKLTKNIKNSNIEILNEDALKFNFHNNSIIFLFNPFDKPTLVNFINKIIESKLRICIVFWGHNKFECFPKNASKIFELSRKHYCLVWKNEGK
jgi:SAM-dependent methyltransferase